MPTPSWAALTPGSIVANNDGDIIRTGLAPEVTVIGGTGNDQLFASIASGAMSLLAAGTGNATLVGGGASTIFDYNGGIDTITNFRPGASSADVLDLSSVSGVTNFAAAIADATQSNANTVINFGAGHTITLDNVVLGDLTQNNFVFNPFVAYVQTPAGANEADAGTTLPITLTISDAVTVDMSGGAPSLLLSNGATATYDAQASNPAGHLLVFDYSVGAGDQSANLSIASVNPNGATIVDGAGHAVDFSAALNKPTGVRIGASPLMVTSVTPSLIGEADTGTFVQLTLQLNEPVTVNLVNSLGKPLFDLALSDGGTAIYDPGASNPATGTLVFDDTVAAGDHTPNLTITGVTLALASAPANATTVQDAAGNHADMSKAVGELTGLAINPALYVASIATNAAASPTGVGQEADAGQTFQLAITLNQAATLNAGGNLPTLTLSDGSTATYDAGASNLDGGTLVFDDTVAANDHAPNLSVSAVNLFGGNFKDASGDVASFAGAINTPIGLQVGTSPLFVTGLSAVAGTTFGEPNVTFTLTMSETVATATAPGINQGLLLNNGDIAIFQSAAANQLTFTDFNPTGDDVNASIALVDLIGIANPARGIVEPMAKFQDAAGYNADFSGALNIATGVTIGHPLYVQAVTSNSSTGVVSDGQTVQISLDMSEPVVLTGGTPGLTLNDGGTATYDPAASNLATGTLGFDYTPGTGVETTSLNIASVNLNGATIKDLNGNAADFAGDPDMPVQLQVGPATVNAVATSLIGDLLPGQSMNFLLDMSRNVDVDTTGGIPTLTLSNNAVATYDAALTATTAADSPTSVGDIVFDYTIGADDATNALTVTSVNRNGAVITDGVSGQSADLSAAAGQYSGITIQCFAAGTHIATTDGPVAVEDLAIGQSVWTQFGGSRPITWIGRRHVNCHMHRNPRAVWPIHVAAHAFGEGRPGRDLWLSPDHAVFVEDVLIPIRYLIDDHSVRQEPCHTVCYYHIELAQHDVVFAENLAVESYLDSGDRTSFANGGGPVVLHPEFSLHMWEAMGCAPLIVTGPVVTAVRARLRHRAMEMAVEADLRKSTSQDARAA